MIQFFTNVLDKAWRRNNLRITTLKPNYPRTLDEVENHSRLYAGEVQSTCVWMCAVDMTFLQFTICTEECTNLSC